MFTIFHPISDFLSLSLSLLETLLLALELTP